MAKSISPGMLFMAADIWCFLVATSQRRGLSWWSFPQL
jgi:hypothetical protein